MPTTELIPKAMIIKLWNRLNSGTSQLTLTDQEHCTYGWVTHSYLFKYVDLPMNLCLCDIHVCFLVWHESVYAMGAAVGGEGLTVPANVRVPMGSARLSVLVAVFVLL